MAWRLQELPDSYLVPPALAATYDALYLHGGVKYSGETVRDLSSLDLATGRWARLHTDGAQPTAPSGHSLVAVRGRLLLLGARRDHLISPKNSPPAALQPDRAHADEDLELPPAAELWMLEVGRQASSVAGGGATSLPLRWERHPIPAPLSRLEHCAAPHEAAGTMLVVGGTSGASGRLLDDV